MKVHDIFCEEGKESKSDWTLFGSPLATSTCYQGLAYCLKQSSTPLHRLKVCNTNFFVREGTCFFLRPSEHECLVFFNGFIISRFGILISLENNSFQKKQLKDLKEEGFPRQQHQALSIVEASIAPTPPMIITMIIILTTIIIIKPSHHHGQAGQPALSILKMATIAPTPLSHGHKLL